MLRTERRVVITGLGSSPRWVSVSSRSGQPWPAAGARFGKIRAFPIDGLPNDLGGEVLGFDKKAMIDWPCPGSRRRSARA